jgi:multiple sugar transport system substrate-binding protein
VDRKPLSRRQFLGLASATVVGSALAACGATPTPGPTATARIVEKEVTKVVEKPVTQVVEKSVEKVVTATPMPAAPVTLRVMYRDAAVDKWEEPQIKKYMEKNPKITIKYEVVPSYEGQKQLVILASGDWPDIWWDCDNCGLGERAMMGTYLDIKPLIDKAKLNMDDYMPGTWASATIGGKIYGFPYIAHPGVGGLLINKTLFEKEGVPVPKPEYTNEAHPGWKDWTFDHFLEACKKLTKKDSAGRTTQWGFANGTMIWWVNTPIRCMGGDYLSPDGKKSTINTPEAREAIKFLADLNNKWGVVPKPGEASGWGMTEFASGKVGMVIAQCHNIQSATQTYKNFEWLDIPAPRGKGGWNSTMLVAHFNVLSKTKYPQEAFNFLKDAFCSVEVGMANAKAGTVPGAQKAVWHDPELLKEPNFNMWSKLMDTCSPLVMQANWRASEWGTAWSADMEKLFYGIDTNGDKVIDELNVKLQAILDKPRVGA